MNNTSQSRRFLRDYGDEPFVVDIERAVKMNPDFRTVLRTGKHLQLTLMRIPVNGDIGVEMHENVDQFIRIEEGKAKVYFGKSPNALREEATVNGKYAIVIPAGTWHNVVNVGVRPLKLYSLYAPPQHPFGTVDKTKSDAEHH